MIGRDFTESYTETLGVDYGLKNYLLDDSSTIKLQLWDTAGTKLFRPLLRTYYKGVKLAIFTLDSSQELSAQRELLQEENRQVQAINPAAIRTLVVTKSESDLAGKITAEQINALKAEMNIADHLVFSAKKDDPNLLNEFLIRKIKEAQQPESIIDTRFAQAIKSINDGRVLTNQATKESGKRFLKWLGILKVKTLKDLKDNKLSLREAEEVARSSEQLALKIADLSVKSSDIDTFHSDNASHKKTSLLGKIFGALIGAALGVVAGVMVGMAAGPVAALTALYGGVQGAIIGASVGAAVFGSAGAWCSMWLMKRNHPLTRLEKAAREVEQVLRESPGKQKPELVSRLHSKV